MKSKKGKLLLGLGLLVHCLLEVCTKQPAAAGEVDPFQIDAPPPIPEKEVDLFNKTVKKFQDFLGGFALPSSTKEIITRNNRNYIDSYHYCNG